MPISRIRPITSVLTIMTQLPPDDRSSRLPYYLMVGLLATGAHYITLLLLSFVLPILMSTLIGALVGTLVSYQGNKRWTFVRSKGRSDAHQWLRFGIIAMVYNLGNLSLMVLLLGFCRCPLADANDHHCGPDADHLPNQPALDLPS